MGGSRKRLRLVEHESRRLQQVQGLSTQLSHTIWCINQNGNHWTDMAAT